MITEFEIWKKVSTTGCVMEDESDTRNSKTEFLLIHHREENDFKEFMADDYGNSDYSYSVNYYKIAGLDTEEVLKLAEVLNKFKQKEDNKKMLGEIEE